MTEQQNWPDLYGQHTRLSELPLITLQQTKPVLHPMRSKIRLNRMHYMMASMLRFIAVEPIFN